MSSLFCSRKNPAGIGFSTMMSTLNQRYLWAIILLRLIVSWCIVPILDPNIFAVLLCRNMGGKPWFCMWKVDDSKLISFKDLSANQIFKISWAPLRDKGVLWRWHPFLLCFRKGIWSNFPLFSRSKFWFLLSKFLQWFLILCISWSFWYIGSSLIEQFEAYMLHYFLVQDWATSAILVIKKLSLKVGHCENWGRGSKSWTEW